MVKSDEKLLHIEKLIEAKRIMLINKQRKIRYLAKQNNLLEVVKNDYVNYYNYISQQKQEQIKSLELLNNYIHDLTISGEISKNNIEDAKFEQERILHEIKKIKRGLNNILNNTQEINNKFTEKSQFNNI
jgi:hypothetical protein